MSTPKVKCPICGQEFPVYDQRGFRNAGFTAHHNRCLERQCQQQNESHQLNQLSSRASRFAMAIRRQLLPALPTPTTSIIEGHNVSSLASALPPRDNFAVLSESPASNINNLAPQTNLQHYFPDISLHQQQVRPIARQRHTWNHWNVRRSSRRRTTNSISSISSATLNSPASTPLPTSSRNIRDRRSLPVIKTSTDYANLPLTRAMTVNTIGTTDISTTAIMDTNTVTESMIPPSATSYLPSAPVYSPSMLNSSSLFTFASMLTTLPSGSTSSLPTGTSNPSISNSNNFDCMDSRKNHLTLYQQQPIVSTAPSDWALDYYSSAEMGGSIQEQRYLPGNDQYHHFVPRRQSHQPFNYTTDSINPFQPTDNTTNHQHVNTDALPIYLNDQHPLVLSCNYCRPQNGFHHPSCSLVQLLMSNFMDDPDDPFPPA